MSLWVQPKLDKQLLGQAAEVYELLGASTRFSDQLYNLKEEGFKTVGEGSSRVVLGKNEIVVKLSSKPSARDRGYYAGNRQEFLNTWLLNNISSTKLVTPTWAYGEVENQSFSIAARAEKVDVSIDWEKQLYPKLLSLLGKKNIFYKWSSGYSTVKAFPRFKKDMGEHWLDLKRENVGMYNNEIVLVDYSYSLSKNKKDLTLQKRWKVIA